MFDMARDPKQKLDIEPAVDSVAVRSAVKSLYDNGTQHKDIGSAFTASDEFKELVQSGGATMRKPYEVEVFDLSSMGYKDVYNTLGNHTLRMASAPSSSTRWSRAASGPLACATCSRSPPRRAT